MFVVIWEYELHPGAEAAFEALYGASGAWVGLFSTHVDCIDTQLLRDERPHHYLTLDRWTSATGYARFLDAEPAQYARIDALGGTLTLNERCIGRYESPC